MGPLIGDFHELHYKIWTLWSSSTVVFLIDVFVSCSNPVVQVKAMESGALQTLLTTLATAEPLSVKKKVHSNALLSE